MACVLIFPWIAPAEVESGAHTDYAVCRFFSIVLLFCTVELFIFLSAWFKMRKENILLSV